MEDSDNKLRKKVSTQCFSVSWFEEISLRKHGSVDIILFPLIMLLLLTCVRTLLRVSQGTLPHKWDKKLLSDLTTCPKMKQSGIYGFQRNDDMCSDVCWACELCHSH